MTEKMKPSGIAAIGEIPASWDIVRIKDIGTYRNGLTYSPEDVTDKEYGTLVLRSSNIQNGKLSFEDNVYVSCDIPEDLYTQKGDIIICSRNGSSQLVGKNALVENDDVNCSFGAFMMVYRCDCPRYMYYVLNSEIFSYYLGTFLTSTINQLTGFNFGNMKIAYCPDPHEQQAISDFLDSQCAKIDGVIADIEKQIEILQKYKKSLITEAVTKGLKPDIPMRSSKVEYVSSVPDHWEEKRLNIVAYVRARLGWRGLTADEYVDEGYAFLSAFNIVDDKLDLSEELLNYITKFRYDESPEIKLHSGDVLLVKDGAGLGKCARIDDLPFETAPNGSLAVITPNEQLHYRYLYYFFVGDVFQQRINQIKNGMGVPHLPQGDLRKIVVPIPPMDEQIAISDYLDERCAIVDPLIEEKEKQLETMKQHKKSLIYEYVTGKKQVTEVN